jgi:hypothetical protein
MEPKEDWDLLCVRSFFVRCAVQSNFSLAPIFLNFSRITMQAVADPGICLVYFDLRHIYRAPEICEIGKVGGLKQCSKSGECDHRIG